MRLRHESGAQLVGLHGEVVFEGDRQQCARALEVASLQRALLNTRGLALHLSGNYDAAHEQLEAALEVQAVPSDVRILIS